MARWRKVGCFGGAQCRALPLSLRRSLVACSPLGARVGCPSPSPLCSAGLCPPPLRAFASLCAPLSLLARSVCPPPKQPLVTLSLPRSWWLEKRKRRRPYRDHAPFPYRCAWMSLYPCLIKSRTTALLERLKYSHIRSSWPSSSVLSRTSILWLSSILVVMIIY